MNIFLGIIAVVLLLGMIADTEDNQLEDNGTYVKHFIGLSDNVSYVVEDLNLGENEVNKYNPKMWIPVEGAVID